METAETSTEQERRPSRLSRLRHRIGLAAVLALGVVAWEYLLNAIMNPGVDWSPLGVGSHMAMDVAFFLPLVAIALGLGLRWAKRFQFDLEDSAGLLGVVGVVCFLIMAMALPLTSTRDMAHEWVGQEFGLALAEVQTTVVTSDLTVQESTQLCSFGSLRNPSLARDGYQLYAQTLMARAAAGFEDVLIQQAAFLPLLFLGLFFFSRRRSVEFNLSPAAALFRTKAVRITCALAVIAAVGFALGSGSSGTTWNAVEAGTTTGGFNACTDGGEVKEYNVFAIDITMTLNRWGDHVNGAYMYALEANVPAIKAFEASLDRDREAPEGPGVARVSMGLRKDLIQPLVIRANLGDCLRVNFTNALADTRPASMHILGLPHSVTSAGSAVGNNPDTFAQPGETVTYEIPMPLDPDAERSYYFHDHGAGRQRQNMGLFGAIVAEPRGATYLDVETGEPLDTVTGSNWEAIIVDPNLDNRPDGKSFREFIILYHEIGDEGFTDLRDREDKKLPLIDEIGGVYRPAARAINYRSEPFRRRLELDKKVNGDQAGHGKSLGYSSYPFGDPPTPVPRSYVGEGVKTRVMHGGSEIFHVHHLHGGGDRWRRNPNADPNNDFWKGLTKVPDPNLTSIHLDSQSIGPGTSYNLEHECGAGGCQQGVGDFLFHCHIGHHYIAGMWSFWRVFGTTQTAETNVNGFPLAAVPELFQTESPLMNATPPADGVSAGGLLGLTVDHGRVLTDGPTTSTTKNLAEWISDMLPPAGVPLDNSDATVWNWASTGSGSGLQVWGEPEIAEPFQGYIPTTPGERPEVLFNPKNGRYVWPLFRPQPAARPPFTARHSGAPWLGEEMNEGRLDGLCGVNGVAGLDLGPVAKRFYPVSAITLPIQVTPDKQDPDGMIFVLNEEEQAVRNGSKPTDPLAIRSNVGDCVEILFTNQIPDSDVNKDFSKVNIHSHFVQFDTQASDGVITGFSYEQSVRPFANEDRRLTAPAAAGSTTLAVNHTDRLREGIWLGIGLGEGTCGTTAQGQPARCTEIRKITGLTANSITLDQPLSKNHGSGEDVGVEFVRYHWYSDVDFGTVFYHQHVEFKDWDHGLFGTHIVEPKGSTYHDPVTGAPVRSGTLVDIRVDPSAGGNPVAAGVDGSFREFMLFLHNNNPVEGRFTRGGGNINLRAEPWRLREGDPAYRFSSVTHGDPHTQTVRAYVGDPVVVRGMGLVERVGGIRFTGHRFNSERYTDDSDTRDAQFIGISERFDVSLEGGAGGTGGYPGDYLYYSTLGKDFESGGWGILRAHDTAQPDLQPLPGRTPRAGAGFPQLSETGSAPPRLRGGRDNACPADAPVKEYALVIADSEVIYNDLSAPDRAAVVYRENGKPSKSARTPIVMRVNAGECLVVKLRNVRDVRSSISIGELVFDPQRSYGSAIGYNYDSTIPARRGRAYRYYADRELGIVVGINLGDIDSVERGAFAGVVVEPEGSTYTRPGGSGLLPQGGLGVQADVVTGNSEGFREFVALFNDQDRRIGQSAMPYPDRVENFTGINYSAEPLALRDMANNPADVFKTSLWGDPRHVVTVPAGTPMRYRVSQPWGNQMHVPTLEGHRYYLEPRMQGSEQVYNDVLGPGMSIDMHVVGGAGGDISAPGDYLFLDRRQPFMEAGLWNILRVTDDGTSGSADRITVNEMQLTNLSGNSSLVLEGTVTPRPAGDTVPYVTVHEGAQTDSGCRGKVLARVPVDPGSGKWELDAELAGSPERVCVQSPAGGSLEGLATP